MATANNTIKTRIQLKSDTEENWNKAGPKNGTAGFVPLSGELIVYTPDATHPFSRLKVGNGETNVVDLPFIDSGTLNGNETEIVKKVNYQNFPISGSEDKLYVDLATSKIYHYTENSGYSQLSNFDYSPTKSTIGSVISWSAGAPTLAYVENGVLKIDTGISPRLLWETSSVVTNITKQ